MLERPGLPMGGVGFIAPQTTPPSPQSPTVITAPVVSQAKDTLSCTKGTWNGAVTYDYRWQQNGVDVVGVGNKCIVGSGDVGTTFVCIVTASNNAGSTDAPSNALVVATWVVEEVQPTS